MRDTKQPKVSLDQEALLRGTYYLDRHNVSLEDAVNAITNPEVEVTDVLKDIKTEEAAAIVIDVLNKKTIKERIIAIITAIVLALSGALGTYLSGGSPTTESSPTQTPTEVSDHE